MASLIPYPTVSDLSDEYVRFTSDPNAYCQWGVKRMGVFEECGASARMSIHRPQPVAFAPSWVVLCNRHGGLIEDLLWVAYHVGRKAK